MGPLTGSSQSRTKTRLHENESYSKHAVKINADVNDLTRLNKDVK